MIIFSLYFFILHDFRCGKGNICPIYKNTSRQVKTLMKQFLIDYRRKYYSDYLLIIKFLKRAQ